MQRLVTPFKAKKLLLAAGYKVPGYLAGWGFPHYGHDYGFRDPGYDVYACGEGEVIACGLDGDAPYGSGAKLGRCVVIRYRDVLCPDGVKRDLACQMCHFDSTTVEPGQLVDTDTIIGQYGNTGGREYTAHLHIQFDTDASNPRWMYGIASTGNVMRKGTVDSTIAPHRVWYLREGQTMEGINGETYFFPEEVAVQTLPKEEEANSNGLNWKARYDALVAGIKKLINP